MRKTVRQGIVKYLAVVSLAASGYADEGARTHVQRLRDVPEQLVSELIDEVEEPVWAIGKRKRVLELLAHDPRPAVRARVAGAAASLWPHLPADAEALLRQLCNDRAPSVRTAAGAALAKVLDSSSPPDRLRVLSDWVNARSRAERAAAAVALQGRTPLFITDLAIEQLAGDQDPKVRRLALGAAAVHFDQSPALYSAIVSSMTNHPDRQVRHRARRLLRRAPELLVRAST